MDRLLPATSDRYSLQRRLKQPGRFCSTVSGFREGPVYRLERCHAADDSVSPSSNGLLP